MKEKNSLTDQLSNTADQFWTSVGDYLPKLLTAFVLFIIALFVAKIIKSIVMKILDFAGLNNLLNSKKVADSLKMGENGIDFVGIIGRIVFWIVLIIFALTIADVLDLTAMRDVIRELLAYLPNIVAAILVLTVTIAGASLLRDVIHASLARMKLTFAATLSTVAFYVLVVFGSLMALDQLGFDTTILTANITIIVGGIVLALALAFGLGGQKVAGEIVDKAYRNSKKAVKK